MSIDFGKKDDLSIYNYWNFVITYEKVKIVMVLMVIFIINIDACDFI